MLRFAACCPGMLKEESLLTTGVVAIHVLVFSMLIGVVLLHSGRGGGLWGTFGRGRGQAAVLIPAIRLH